MNQKVMLLIVMLLPGWGNPSWAAPGTSLALDHAINSLLLDITAYEQTLVAVGQRGHILRSEDDGKTWSLQPSPTQHTLTSVTFQDQNTLIAAGHSLTILKSVDSGISWQVIEHSQQDSAPWLDVLALNESEALLVGAYGYYARTNDKGVSWTFDSPIESDFHFNHLTRLSDSSQLLLSAEAGMLYLSSDLGQQWQSIETPDGVSFFHAVAMHAEPVNPKIIKPGLVRLFGLGGLMLEGQPSSPTLSWKVLYQSGNHTYWSAEWDDQSRLWLVGSAGQLRRIDFSGQSEHMENFDQPNRKAMVSALWHQQKLWTVGEAGIQVFDENAKPLRLSAKQ